MKFVLLFVIVFFSIPVFSQEFPVASHVDVCGDGTVEMSDEALSEMLDCVLEQRDAMGYLMDRWSNYTDEVRRECIARSSSGETVDYIGLEACVKE
ncbi:hypothetical protein Q9247_09730 [Halomonas meridiana]|uniref:hypothetical protein n=1 Tax=Vreelandella aquamarina TaxID=77097 RepID=UPI00273BEE25|nr:hypothetical protein [Halomonas meridiana]MDP4557962.1 hypothetical protein [Halomonas meridiana]